MRTFIRAALRYRVVTLTVLVGVAGAILWAASQNVAVQILFSAFALAVGAVMAWRMLRDLRNGHFGVDVLAVATIATTANMWQAW